MNEKQTRALIREVAQLIRDLKRDPTYSEWINRARDVSDEDQGMVLTIGVDADGSWGWQSGDNSFTGGAYGFPYWGVGVVTGRCNSLALAREMVDEALDQMEAA